MRSVFFVGLLVAIPVLAEPFSLDTIVPAKLPATMKPPKGMPSEVLAIFAPQRGDRIDCLALRPDGKYLALGGPDQNVRLWDLEKTRLAATLKLPTPVVCLAFSPDGKTLTIGDSNGNIRIHKNEGGGSYLFKSMLVAHKDMPIWSLTFSPDGGRLYSAARDKSAAVWDISKPKAVKTGSLDGHEVEVRSLSLSADGELAATAGNQDLTIRLWNLSGEKPKVAGSLKLSERVVSIGLAPGWQDPCRGRREGHPGHLRTGRRETEKTRGTRNRRSRGHVDRIFTRWQPDRWHLGTIGHRRSRAGMGFERGDSARVQIRLAPARRRVHPRWTTSNRPHGIRSDDRSLAEVKVCTAEPVA